jgi:hypothetical protein
MTDELYIDEEKELYQKSYDKGYQEGLIISENKSYETGFKEGVQVYKIIK